MFDLALLFLRLEEIEPWQELVPVDRVGVQFGSIDAGVLADQLAVDQLAAAVVQAVTKNAIHTQFSTMAWTTQRG